MGTKNLNSATDMITFTRASGGTALRKISYGSELVTNGNDWVGASGATLPDGATNSGWYENSNGTYSVTNGTLTITNGTSGRTGFYWPISVVAGATYLAEWENQTGNIQVRIVDSINPNDTSPLRIFNLGSTGTKSFVATQSTLYVSVTNYSTSSGATGTLDNISVKEVLYDQPDGTLQLFNHLANTPRIEYSADGTVKGLLIEEARTNSVTYSNDFNDSNWNKYLATVTSNVTTAPDGTNSADSVVIQGSEGAVYRTVNASGSHTWSIFAKAFSTSYLKLRSSNTGEDTSFNLSGAGSVGTSNSNHTASIESVGNGWYRCVVTSNSTNNRFTIYPVASDDASSASGDSLYIYGAQLEAGTFPTSYIPTSGATATRAADVASIPVDNFGYNDDAGTVVVTGASSHKAGDSGLFYLYENNSNFIGAKFSNHSSPNSIQTRVVSSGATLAQLYPVPALANTPVNYAVGFATNNVSAVIDGGTIKSDTNVDIITVSQMSIGYRGPYNDQQLNGHIKSIKYYPRRLTNTQLQELTT